MRYAAAWMRREDERTAYQVYVTDALQAIAENTAKYGGGSYIKIRWYDVIHPKPVETRTAEEIIAQVTSRLKGGAKA